MKLDFDSYFMNIAEAVKLRSPDIIKVGAVLVSSRLNRVLSTGMNGTPKGFDDTKINWANREQVSKYIIHAETNALLYADSKFEDSKLYTTRSPCRSCIKLLAAAGVREVIYGEPHKDLELVAMLCLDFDIELRQTAL